jgi:hypothetical protein
MYGDQARRRDEMLAEQRSMNEQQRTMNAFTIDKEKQAQRLAQHHRNAFTAAYQDVSQSGRPFGIQDLAQAYVMKGGNPEMAMKMMEDAGKGFVKVGENESLYDPRQGRMVVQGQGGGLTGEAKNLRTILGRDPTMEDYLGFKRAGATNVNVDVNKKSMVALGEEMGKDLVKQREKAETIIASVNHLNEAKLLLDKGIITGTGADFLTKAGNALATIGIKNFEDPVANTQAYTATMGRQVGENIKLFGAGTGLSDADREYAEKMAGGKVEINEKAIRKIININERQGKFILSRYNQKAEEAMKRPGADQLPYDLRIDLKKVFGGEAKPTRPAAEQSKVKVEAPQQAIEYLKQHPEAKEQFKEKYGYLPEGY